MARAWRASSPERAIILRHERALHTHTSMHTRLSKVNFTPKVGRELRGRRAVPPMLTLTLTMYHVRRPRSSTTYHTLSAACLVRRPVVRLTPHASKLLVLLATKALAEALHTFLSPAERA